jgi:hypothetical protein
VEEDLRQQDVDCNSTDGGFSRVKEILAVTPDEVASDSINIQQ